VRPVARGVGAGARIPATDAGVGARGRDAGAAQVSEPRPDMTSRLDIRVLSVPKLV
jgi:hypothetical protein